MGPELAVAARLALAAAFAWSAGVKLARPRAFAEGLVAFGVPAAGVVARLLPGLEAAVAVTLLALPDATWPGLAAAGVLTVFTVAVAANLARGNTAPCPCFGVASRRALSVGTLGRNAYLLFVAAVATRPPDGADVGLVAVATAVLGFLTLVVVRRFE